MNRDCRTVVPDETLHVLGNASRRPLLTREDEVRLARRVERGDPAARQRFIEANLRLVIAIARQFEGAGVPLGDLVQEGNIGLIHAVDHFDWRKGTRFSTCAALWIRQAIQRALPSLRYTIRVPSQALRERRRFDRSMEHLSQQLQRAPTAPELERQYGHLDERWGDLRALPLDCLSLDTPDEDEERWSLAERLADQEARAPEVELLRSFTQQRLDVALEDLSPREQRIVTLHYGLGGCQEHTLAEIGALLGLSRQRVNQIESVALRRLRTRLRLEPSLDSAGAA